MRHVLRLAVAVLALSSAGCFSIFDISSGADDPPAYKPPPPAPTSACNGIDACHQECDALGGPACTHWVVMSSRAGTPLAVEPRLAALHKACMGDDLIGCYLSGMNRVAETGDVAGALADTRRGVDLKLTTSDQIWHQALIGVLDLSMCLSGVDHAFAGPDAGKDLPLTVGQRQGNCLGAELRARIIFPDGATYPGAIAAIPAIPWSRATGGDTADLALLPRNPDWYCFRTELRQDNLGRNTVRTGDAPVMCEASADLCQARRDRLKINASTHFKGECQRESTSFATCFTNPKGYYTCSTLSDECATLKRTLAEGGSACVPWARTSR